MDELKARFGEKAESLMKAYTLSSRVITFLIQYSLSDPNMYTWPETDIGGLLEFYLETPTSDRCVLQTIPEFVAGLVKGRPGGKRTPHDSAAQFNEYSEGILAALRGIVPGEDEKELRSSLVDFKVLAYLARYHALKTEAGIRVEVYFQTGDGSRLLSLIHIWAPAAARRQCRRPAPSPPGRRRRGSHRAARAGML